MSQKHSPVRIGLIGAGANTRLQHIPGFAKVPGVSIDLVANRSEQSAHKVAEEFGIPRVAANWQEVVADPQIDAVCIGTWPYMHCELTLAALAAGKHVLTEARMAMNADEARRMLEAANANPQLVAQIVPAPFSLRYDATIKRLLRELAPLYEVSVTHTTAAAASPSAPISWRQRTDLSGNNILSMGIFYETLQRWLGAGVEPVQVKASGSIATPTRPDAESGTASREVTIADAIGIVGLYNNGARFQHHYSSLSRAPARMEITLNLAGGTLVYDLCAQTLTLYAATAPDQPAAILPDPATDIGWNVEADFIHSIRSGTPVTLTSFEDGVRYMQFTDSVQQSLKQNS